MSNVNGAFAQQRHRIEGVVGVVLMAAWVIGSIVTVGLQNGVIA